MSITAGKGLRAVADQAFFVGAVFVLHVMFARTSVPRDYGIFAVAYTWFILLSAVQHGAIIEPMMVFGSGHYRNSCRSYIAHVTRLQWMGAIPISALLFGIVVLVYPLTRGELGPALGSMLATGPAVMWHHLRRKALYVEGYLTRAAWSSGVYLVVICVASLGAGRYLGWSAPTAFLILGVASALAGIAARSPRVHPHPGTSASITTSEVWSRHVAYGKWSVFTWVLKWIPMNLYMLYMGYISLGVAAAGVLKAMMNLNAPGIQLVVATSAVILPHLSRLYSSQEFRQFNQTVRSLTSLTIIFGLVYLLAIAAMGRPLVEFVYGPQYVIGWLGIALAAAYPLVAGLSSVLTNALRAAENAEIVFWSSLVAAVATVVIGIPLLHLAGVTGALAGGLAAQLAGVAYLWFRRDGRKLLRRLTPAGR